MRTSKGRPVQKQTISNPGSNTVSDTIVRLPSTLNLQNRLARPSDSNILEIPALHLELDPWGGAECP